MKKYDLPLYLSNSLDEQGAQIFLQAATAAEQKGSNKARCVLAGLFALQDAGYCKDPSGKWKLLEKANTLTVKIEKAQSTNVEKRQVFGFFSVVETDGVPVVDLHGDVIKAQDLEDAIYKYVKFSRMGDDRHDGRCKAVLIESMFFSKEKQEALGIDLGYIGWWGGFEVLDDIMWAKIQKGEYESFSIGGQGRYEQFNV